MDTNQAAEIFFRIRQHRPLIHQITNFVVMNTSANMTLCIGALPVMAHALEEVEEMVSAAGALVLNIGTLCPEQIASMRAAGLEANKRGIPVILDPVGAGATQLRTKSALGLLQDIRVDVVRGNYAEVATLAGIESKISGVESIGVKGNTAAVAAKCSQQHGCVTVITGPTDVITDGKRLFRVTNGHPMMANITGTGCMSTVVVAACAAVEQDYAKAATAALAAYGLAGEIAAAKSQGPGSFQVEFFDAIAALSATQVESGIHLEESSL